MTTSEATDRTMAVEFPYPPRVVFRAVANAISDLPGMTFHEFDRLSGHVYLTTAASAFLGGKGWESLSSTQDQVEAVCR